jgi:hypothetical protein
MSIFFSGKYIFYLIITKSGFEFSIPVIRRQVGLNTKEFPVYASHTWVQNGAVCTNPVYENLFSPGVIDLAVYQTQMTKKGPLEHNGNN